MSKIIWTESKTIPLALTGSVRVKKLSGGYNEAPSETAMFEISDWVKQTGIGRRTSYDTFKFRNRADMGMFLVRWNNTDANNSP